MPVEELNSDTPSPRAPGRLSNKSGDNGNRNKIGYGEALHQPESPIPEIDLTTGDDLFGSETDESDIDIIDRFRDILADSEPSDTRVSLPTEPLFTEIPSDISDTPGMNSYENVENLGDDDNFSDANHDDDANQFEAEDKEDINDVAHLDEVGQINDVEKANQAVDIDDVDSAVSEPELTETIVRTRIQTDESIISDFVRFEDVEFGSEQPNDEQIPAETPVTLKKQAGNGGTENYIHFEDIFDGSPLSTNETNPPENSEEIENQTDEDLTENYIHVDEFFAASELLPDEHNSQNTSIELREQTEENDDDNLIELEAVTDSYESSNDDAIPVVTSIELRHRSAEIGEANIPGYEDNDPQNKASAENVTSTGVSVSIRSQPDELRDANVEDMIRNNKFYDRLINPQGIGLTHRYIFVELNHNEIVIDELANLMWQRNGSAEPMNFYDATGWIEKLNRDCYAGFDDWRLPTLAEAMSLMENKPKNGDLYIDAVFGQIQQSIWTNDCQPNKFQNWMVNYSKGFCGVSAHDNYNFVKAVRYDEKFRSNILV